MIRGQISVDVLRQDIVAAEQVCAIVVVEASGLIELVGGQQGGGVASYARDCLLGDSLCSPSPETPRKGRAARMRGAGKNAKRSCLRPYKTTLCLVLV